MSDAAAQPHTPAQAIVDLDAIRHNVAVLREKAAGAQLMAVVKADAYGHGMVPCASAALGAGADWLGVAHAAEALKLRRAGIGARMLCLMSVPGEPWEDVIAAGVDVTAGSTAVLTEITSAAARLGRTARVQLKADTGLSRGGAPPGEWPALVDAALAGQAAGQLRVTGVWSHFACADEPGHPSIHRQLDAFACALNHAEKAGAEPEVRHMANTAAILTLPEAAFDLVRPGGGLYGLSTLPGGAPPDLRPAMTLRTRLAQVKHVPKGTGVSYGHRHVTSRPATLGLVPVGYADGVPRAASASAQGRVTVSVRGRRWPVAGTVCMDQFVVDFGGEPAACGDEVVLFGPGDAGEPTAQEWGEALGTISYEIVTGIGNRITRVYCEVT
jgi:alanine racemase